ncbi:hypothetical protein ASG90_00820 [Nocardioides sp. Soil797]|nr:hypothetical protein ASG90_00820 [Nocardioides sp. Soil797]
MPRLSRQYVVRPRVARLLHKRAPLTVLAAPHGYGKSVAMVGWLCETFADTDLVCRIDLTAGSTRDDAWSEIRQWFTGEVDADPTTALGSFGDWLRTGDQPVILAIDSSHVLPDDTFLHQLVELLRAHTRLFALVAARRVPEALVDITHAVDTVVITQRELGLSADDSLALFAAYGVNDGRDQCLALHEAVDGWPTLVHRAVVAVADFLARDAGDRSVWPLGPAEALRAARVDAQAFVIDSMLPEMLTADQLSLARLCALAGTVDSDNLGLLTEYAGQVHDEHSLSQQLTALTRVGVLTARQELDRTVWTMPELVGESLRMNAAEELPVELVEALQRRFIAHFTSQEMWHEAMTGALALNDHQLLTDVIADGWGQLAIAHDSLLREAVGRIPHQLLEKNPVAWSVKGFLENSGTELDHEELPDDPQALAELASGDKATQHLLDHLTHMLAMRTSGRLDEAVTTTGRLMRFLELTLAVKREEVEVFAPAIHTQAAVTAQVVGDLTGAGDLFRSALAIGEADPSQLAIPNAESGLGLLAAIEGRTSAASDWVERARRHPTYPGWLGRRLRTSRLVAEAWLALDRLDKAAIDPVMGELIAQADDDELWGYIVEVRSMHNLLWSDSWSALDHLRRLRRRRSAQAPPGSYAANALIFAMFDHHLVLGQGTSASQVLLAAPPDHPGTALRRATMALMVGRPEEVLAEPFAQGQISIRRRIHIHLLRACAQLDVGEIDDASGSIGKALRFAREQGAFTPFGCVPVDRLADLLDKSDVDNEDRETLAFLVDLAPSPLPSSVKVIELTERERAVLKGIEVGLSVAQMASADYLSANTIKSQARTLYRKLGASNRLEALDRARGLGLLADPLG